MASPKFKQGDRFFSAGELINREEVVESVFLGNDGTYYYKMLPPHPHTTYQKILPEKELSEKWVMLIPHTKEEEDEKASSKWKWLPTEWLRHVALSEESKVVRELLYYLGKTLDNREVVKHLGEKMHGVKLASYTSDLQCDNEKGCMVCPECDGEGWAIWYAVDEYDEEYEAQEKCDECNGIGIVPCL